MTNDARRAAANPIADRQLVLFGVGAVVYGLPIERVREVVNPQPLIALPHAPPEIAGVTDHRGEVVPVVDLRTRFGLPPVEAPDARRRMKWILVELGPHAMASEGLALVDTQPARDRSSMRSSGIASAANDLDSARPRPIDPSDFEASARSGSRLTALVVDVVQNVFHFRGPLRPPPPLGSGDDARGIVGVIARSGGDAGLIFVLDVQRLRALIEPLGALSVPPFNDFGGAS